MSRWAIRHRTNAWPLCRERNTLTEQDWLMRQLVPLITTVVAIVLPAWSAFGVEQLFVAPQDQACEVDNDCVIVSMLCSTCECGTPVNRLHEQGYVERYRALCKDYQGGVCDYYCRTPYPRCIDRRCTMTGIPPSR